MCNIKRDETWAAIEHTAHTRHISGIEMCNIKRDETWAAIEHIAHIRHILGIKILYAFYLLQFNEILEPRITTRRSCIGKRGFEYNFGNFSVVSVPFWQFLATIEFILIFA